MYVTGIGATASVGDPEPDGSVVAIVKPWWSSTAVKRGGPRIVREPLAEIQVHVPCEIPHRRRKAYVDAYVQDHEAWAAVMASGELRRRWRGIEWE